MEEPREDRDVVQASRVVLATPRALFRAFLDPETMAGWRRFDGVDLTFSSVNARIGGGYRIRVRALSGNLGPALPEQLDLAAKFVELVGEERIVEAIRVASKEPALSVLVTLTTTFEADRDGTKVTVQAHGAHDFIDAEKQAEILAASLLNLALLTE